MTAAGVRGVMHIFFFFFFILFVFSSLHSRPLFPPLFLFLTSCLLRLLCVSLSSFVVTYGMMVQSDDLSKRRYCWCPLQCIAPRCCGGGRRRAGRLAQWVAAGSFCNQSLSCSSRRRQTSDPSINVRHWKTCSPFCPAAEGKEQRPRRHALHTLLAMPPALVSGL